MMPCGISGIGSSGSGSSSIGISIAAFFRRRENTEPDVSSGGCSGATVLSGTSNSSGTGISRVVSRCAAVFFRVRGFSGAGTGSGIGSYSARGRFFIPSTLSRRETFPATQITLKSAMTNTGSAPYTLTARSRKMDSNPETTPPVSRFMPP